MPVLPMVAPALPLHTAGKYVAGAYVVFLVVVVLYVAIMGVRLRRLERDMHELQDRASPAPAIPGPAEARKAAIAGAEVGDGEGAPPQAQEAALTGRESSPA